MEALYQTGARMKPGPGSLLIAPPAMTDSRFSRTVNIITHKNSEGAFALCLNKPTKHTAKQISQELDLDKELPFQMYWGGPVSLGSIWMVHDDSWAIKETIFVDEKWRVTSHKSMFHHMADGDVPRNFRLCFGFCSWMPGQLEMELSGTAPFSKRSSWVFVKDVDPEWLFDVAVDELWDDATALAADKAIDYWF